MNRIDQLSEDSAVNRLVTVRRGFDELKSTAQTMGSTSVRLQRIVTANTADFSVNATYHTISCWEITFTANGEGIPNTGMLWHLFIDGFNAVGSGSQFTFAELVSVVGSVWTERFWTIGTTSGQSLSYDVKLVIYAMTQGTISVSQIL